jgi:hypothetical protein
VTVTLETLSAQLAAMSTRVNQRESQIVNLLNAISQGIQIMTAIVDQTQTAEQAEAVKIDAVLAALADGRTHNQDLSTQITTLQAQIADLIANGSIGAADQAKLNATLAEIQAKSALIDAALTPPAP